MASLPFGGPYILLDKWSILDLRFDVYYTGITKSNEIKRVLLAVVQSRSLHVVHEAYFCESCFRDVIYQHFNFKPS